MIPKKHILFTRFLMAGIINAIFGWIVYSITILFGFASWFALIIGLIAGITFNFATIGGYVFRSMTLQYLPKFIASYVLIYLINLSCLQLIEQWIIQPILSQLILTPPIAIISYILQSYFVFKKTSYNLSNSDIKIQSRNIKNTK